MNYFYSTLGRNLACPTFIGFKVILRRIQTIHKIVPLRFSKYSPCPFPCFVFVSQCEIIHGFKMYEAAFFIYLWHELSKRSVMLRFAIISLPFDLFPPALCLFCTCRLEDVRRITSELSPDFFHICRECQRELMVRQTTKKFERTLNPSSDSKNSTR